VKPTINLTPIFHKNEEQIGIFFKNDLSLNIIIRKHADGTWSQTKKCWYVPLNQKAFEKLKIALNEYAILDTTLLKKYLKEKKTKSSTSLQLKVKNIISGNKLSQLIQPISPVNNHVLPAMKEMLNLKAFSLSTIKTYLNEMAQLLQAIKEIPADELKPEHLKKYLVYCFEKLGLKENTLHSRINAMKFYYEQVLRREKFFWEIPRPKKQLILPKVLNEEELERLFRALPNLKHKAMLFTVYSAGLRVSELANLRIRNIDSGRMQIFIENAKGKKDRYVNLSPILLDILRSYLRKYRPKPVEFLFESEQTGKAYPRRTIQKIFEEAKDKAGINKKVGIHSLRHSFATHLLEKGTDIKYIKDILGHFDIRTTERYLHVSKRELANIASPLDDLWRKGKISF
jgi:site-specific recombinase XerD